MMAGVILPMAIAPQEMAKRAMCASNLQAISNGLHAYIEDYDHHFPSASYSSRVMYVMESSRSRGPYMQDLLLKYIPNGRVWMCPSVNPQSTIPMEPNSQWPNLSYYKWISNCGESPAARSMPTNYLWNHMRISNNQYVLVSGSSTLTVLSPSEALMFLEMPFWSTPADLPHKSSANSGAINALFYDGHVRCIESPGVYIYVDLSSKGWVN